MPKRFEGPLSFPLPSGTDAQHELSGVPHPEERFIMDLWRGRRNAAKVKFQTRGRKLVVLARLDLRGAPHTNPDGQVIGGTHLHLYREDWGDRWAAPLDPSRFRNPNDLATTFEDFCGLCAVINPPAIQAGLT
jgi:hypothetical protein